MAIQRVAVLAAFAMIVVCSAGPTKSKEPPQPTVHVYAVPTFSLKATSPGEEKHYIVKEGSNITLTCETSFTDKNLLIAWIHPKAKNEFEEKQIHSRHEGKNIKERILHIKNARPEDSGSYTCHTRSLHQKTWSSPNTFLIQVGESPKAENIDATKKEQKYNPKQPDTPTFRTAKISLKKSIKTSNGPSTTIPTKATSKSTTKTATTPKGTTMITSSTTTTTTTLPPATTTSTLINSTQKSPSTTNQFNVASFFGGMALIVGVLILVKLIQAIIHKRRQQSYGYLNM